MSQRSPFDWLAMAGLLVATLSFGPISQAQSQKPASAGESQDQAYEELARQTAELERFSRVFEAVAKLVSPCVVHIQSKKAASFMERNYTLEETGSGVIVRLPGLSEPYLLTNHHVIENVKPEQLIITTNERRLVHAVRKWIDKASDVAVLAIEEKDSPAARLGDSDHVGIGHWVLAIGSPFDQAGSVTHGIVSGKGRRSLKLGSGSIINQDFIQTDASINPGNSGGPLVNVRGEIIGINTAIASQSGGSEGVGFAIPINLVRRIVTELIQKGSVTRAYLGIGTEGVYPQLDPLIASKLGLSNGRGGLVQEVYPDTPAASAGLQPLDVILEINSQPIEDIYHLTHTISLKPVGEQITLLIWRNRELVQLNATLATRPERGFVPLTEQQNPVPVLAKLGVDVQDLTDADRARLGLLEQKGVLIKQVSPHRDAARLVEPFDVIDQIDGRPVNSTSEVRQAMMNLKPEKGIRVRVARATPQGIAHLEVILKP